MLKVNDVGSEAAAGATRFDHLFARFYSDVFGLLYRVLGDRMAAEDCLQETFLKLADELALQKRPDADVGAWLRRVGLHAAFNQLRSSRRAQIRLERVGRLDRKDDDSDDAGTRPSDVLLRAEERASVRRALAALSDRQQMCLLLRHSGYSYAEIAVTLDVAVGSVGVLLARAEDAFRIIYRRQNHT